MSVGLNERKIREAIEYCNIKKKSLLRMGYKAIFGHLNICF
jgi:hypothetical protein